MTSEKQRERNNKYYQKNKEKVKLRAREYYQTNKEKSLLHKKTPSGRKVSRISDWRRNGVIHDNFDELYEIYLNTKNCELCNVELTIDYPTTKTTRCLDHDHETGLFRNILCNSCNVKRR